MVVSMMRSGTRCIMRDAQSGLNSKCKAILARSAATLLRADVDVLAPSAAALHLRAAEVTGLSPAMCHIVFNACLSARSRVSARRE
jgi:hypothetical protein